MEPFKLICRRAKSIFRRYLVLLPPDVIFFLTLVTFWPTATLNVFYSWLWPRHYRRWDRITETIILGAAPLWQEDIHRLHQTERVTGVINCCREWDWHGELYRRKGIEQLHLPTLDFFAPSIEDCRRGVAFIRERSAKNETVYVHCKAGKGRSTTVVLCYLVKHCGMRYVKRCAGCAIKD